MDLFKARVAQARIDGARPTITYAIGEVVEGDLFPMIEDVYSVKGKSADRWFVVHAKPNCDNEAVGNLKSEGFKAFSPQTKTWAVEHRKKVIRVRPLFPRYLFVGLPIDERGDVDIYTPTKCRGVSHLVRSGGVSGKPVSVREETVGDLILYDESGWLDFTQEKAFRNAARSLVKSGEFSTAMDRVVNAAPDARMRVFLNHFGKPQGCASRYSFL